MTFYGFVYILGFLVTILPFKNFDFFNPSFSYRLYIGIYSAIGAIIGGRIGYALFYEPNYFFNINPHEIIQIYKGGMSYHGGLIGVLAAVYLCDKKGFWINLDKIAISALIVIPIGRIANFYNGELWGIATTVPWGVIFEGADHQLRHPVQIYEAILEGPVSALIIYCSYKKILLKHKSNHANRIAGLISCLYGMCYGYLRSICEYFREPDKIINHLPYHFTLGQILSLILGIISTFLFITIIKKLTYAKHNY